MPLASQDSKKSDDASLDAPPSTTAPPRLGVTTMAQAGSSRAVGNQARKPEEVTRQGTQKMKFVPTLPVRRKRLEAEATQEEVSSLKTVDRGRGRGRGLGRGRGIVPPRPEMQMTASGPFAMGPALAGLSKRRAPRSNFTPTMPMGAHAVSLGERSGAPALSQERARTGENVDKEDEEATEVYSDPDEGVQIVDMDAIKTMDWMAPESLRRERDEGKNFRKRAEAIKRNASGKIKGKQTSGNYGNGAAVEEEIDKNLVNALDLSDSEEEEEMEDLIDDFAMEDVDMDEDSITRQEKLYFFQFPRPLPSFTPAGDGDSTGMDFGSTDSHKDKVRDRQAMVLDNGEKVSSAQDVKPSPAQEVQGEQGKDNVDNGLKDSGLATKPAEEGKFDGVIGQLEVHRSGIIKMRLGNGMLMDVTAATQPSFLQHAVFLDPLSKKLKVLGEVNRRFVVSPDVDRLLQEMDKQEARE